MPDSLKIRDLQNFVFCAEHRTMAQAAVGLGIAQPSLSESILRLEKDLGCRLFYRTRTGINLTPDGRSTLERAQAALKALASVHENYQSISRGRTLILGCHPVVASCFLPQALLGIQSKLPGLQFKVVHETSRRVQDETRAGRLDVGLVVNPSRSPDLHIEKLASDVFTVWKSSRRTVYSRIILDPQLVQSQQILRGWSAVPSDRIETSSLEFIARLTDQGLGFGVLPARLVELLRVRLAKIEDAPKMRDEISLIYRPEFGKSDAEKTILKILRTCGH